MSLFKLSKKTILERMIFLNEFLDPGPEDIFDKKRVKLLQKYRQMYLDRLRYEWLVKRKRLLEQSLEEKWHADMEAEDIARLCPFCKEAWILADCIGVMMTKVCDYCLCPPSICAERTHRGYISELNSKDLYHSYSWWSRCLHKMRCLFHQELVKVTNEIDVMEGLLE